MIAVSQQFKEDIKNDNRLYKPIITITLTSGEVLNITEEQVMMGGVVIDESMSIGENLEIGSVNINKCTVVLNNIEESFSEYDFQDAIVNVEISLDLTTGTTETIQRGIYTVDKANYDNSLVTLTCLDNLSKLDKQITESTLVYPATLGAIANDAFNVCGLNFVTQTFLNDSLVISEKPDKTLSFRTLIGFIAQMAGANVRAMPSGDIEFTWYDKEALGTFAQGFRVSEEVEDRITEDGSYYREGEITEEELPTYSDIDFIPIVYGLNTSMDDIYITGLRVLTYNDEDRDNIEFSYGALNYALTIENNDLVNESNAQRIADTVGQVVVGMRYRKAAVSHCAMPYIQVGDVAAVKDRKGNDYRLLVTSLVFKINDRQSLTSTGKTPARNKAELYSRQTQLAMATNKAVTFYDENLNQAVVYNKLMGLQQRQQTSNSPTTNTTQVNSVADLALILKDGEITLNADYIRAGSINADLIKTGTLNADLIKSGTINADLIKGGSISADLLNGGEIKGIRFLSELSSEVIEGEFGSYNYRIAISADGIGFVLVPTSGNPSYIDNPTILYPLLNPLRGVFGFDRPIMGLEEVVLDSIFYLDPGGHEYKETTFYSLVNSIDKMFVRKTYTYAYTVGANAALNITGTNFGVSTPAGYTPIGFARIDTGNGGSVIRLQNAAATGGTALITVRNVTGSSISATATVVILYARTDSVS